VHEDHFPTDPDPDPRNAHPFMLDAWRKRIERRKGKDKMGIYLPEVGVQRMYEYDDPKLNFRTRNNTKTGAGLLDHPSIGRCLAFFSFPLSLFVSAVPAVCLHRVGSALVPVS